MCNYPAKFVSHKHCSCGDVFNLSLDLSRPHEPLKVSQYPIRFGDDRHCGSGDIIVLVCHMILQDPVTKASSNILGKNPSG